MKKIAQWVDDHCKQTFMTINKLNDLCTKTWLIVIVMDIFSTIKIYG